MAQGNDGTKPGELMKYVFSEGPRLWRRDPAGDFSSVGAVSAETLELWRSRLMPPAQIEDYNSKQRARRAAAPAKSCECGAAKCGALNGSPAHSRWCPVAS